MLKELAEEISEPLAITFEKPWRTGEVPMDGMRANVVPIFKKGEKEDSNIYHPVSLTLELGKVLEQIIKQAMCKHLEENVVRNKSQHRFLRDKSCQTNLISLFDRVTSLVDAGNAVDIVYHDFIKAFDKVPHDILVRKLVKTRLDKIMIQWICNWLADKTQRMLINSLSWKEVISAAGFCARACII